MQDSSKEVQKIIYQETNPYGSFSVFLEEDGRTVYLYLQAQHNEEWKMKTLWIRNLIPAPKERNVDDFKLGLAPLLTQSEVFHTEGLPVFKKEDVSVVWTEEGTGVFLFINEELYGFIPSWSGLKEFHGFAREAKEESITASPMGDPKNGWIAEYAEKCHEYWRIRSEKGSWKKIQSSRLEYFESMWGNHSKYWSADGGKFPQMGIALFKPTPNRWIYATIGMSAQNQPSVDLYHKEPEAYSRIELILAVDAPDASQRSDEWVPHVLGELVNYPWQQDKWFGDGHSLTLARKDPDELYLNFSNLLCVAIQDFPKLITENGNPLLCISLYPITKEENLFLQLDGYAEFLKKIKSRDDYWVHNPERNSLV
jgi:hypothetical protein